MNRGILLRRLRHQLLGLVFLVVVVLFFVTTIGFYNKEFTPVTQVRLETDHVGNQLRKGADVKIRGMVVGEVREISSLGDRAALELALDPDKTSVIPANVSARLLPKTLFGERYVALQPPESPATARLAAGDVIGQDRTSTAIELEKVLGDVMPLLQAVQPQKLASTLTAVSTALEGRGTQLGRTLTQLGDYLGELNPSLPDLTADLKGLAKVSDTYSEAAPDFLQALSDLTTTSKTLVEKQQGLSDMFASVTNASTDLHNFLQVNRNNFIALTSTVQPTLDVLAKYAPEYPCLLEQLAGSVPRAEAAFGKGTDEMNHVTIRFLASRTKYEPGKDEPRYDDKRGPRCYPQVEPPGRWPQYPPDGPIKDGSSKTPPPKGDGKLPAADYDLGGITGGGGAAGGPTLPNSPAELDLISALRAPALGVAPRDVPNWSSLLVGPLYRGAAVEVQ
ncbi:MCE family protein [Amycolatopsis nigrescens]|uniref:MCE family protein n=1 Tax=Amycolatopsis nigrescens TaxID=381445 RepID=UPI0003812C70|nr:MCE family protein [Amycolatopsis nigrescens]